MKQINPIPMIAMLVIVIAIIIWLS